MLQRWAVVLFLLCVSTVLHAAEISGKVSTAVNGEPLARVQITLTGSTMTAVTGNDGTFFFSNLPPGQYTLRLNAVGYRLMTIPVTLTANDPSRELDITLAPDNLRRNENIEVKGDLFQGPDSPAILETNLTATEVRQTSTVLANDPFRSIQTLPGVSAAGNNDYFAQFTVMGVPFEQTGIYVDGVLVQSPFHGADITQGATLSLFTSDTLDDIKMLPAAFPEKYGDAVGAAVDLETRDGSRTRPSFRIAGGLADTELLGEGEIGHAKKGSWLASGRKSYLGYLVRDLLQETSEDVSFYDADLKLVYDLRPNQTVSFYGIGGSTLYDLIHSSSAPTPNDIQRATDSLILGRAGWRWTASPSLLVDTRVAWQEQPRTNTNVDRQPLLNSGYAEWSGGATAIWNWQKHQVLEGGWTSRRARFDVQNYFYSDSNMPASINPQDGNGWKNDGYVQDSATLFDNRLHLLGGLRLDTATMFDIHPLSPQISAAVQLSPSMQMQLGYGRYHQFDFPAESSAAFNSPCKFNQEDLSTADHFTAALEDRLGENTRARLLLFDRQNIGSLASQITGCTGPGTNGFIPIERDYSRGAQIVLQSRTANKLSGWIGYTLVYARERYTSEVLEPQDIHPLFPTLADQRHTVNIFADYRITPTISASGKFLFGSGFPIPNALYNSNRLGDYQRLDLRAEKDWAVRDWKLSLYGELLNATNHYNPRYFYSSYDANGNPTAVTGQGLPILPTAGLAVAF